MAEEDGKKDEEKFDFTREGEVLGYIGVDQARVMTIRHARDNTDFYGPRYSGAALVWEVISEEQSEDYYDIRLSFRPAGRFRGRPGVEQFIIDKTGSIEVRQILDEPSRRRPPVLLLSVVGVVVAGAVAVAAFAAGGLGGGGTEEPIPAPTPLRPPLARTV